MQKKTNRLRHSTSEVGTVPCKGIPALFYVSPQGNDRWSGRLSDRATDGKDGPFATVVRARDAVRALVLDARDSGTESYPVVFEAFSGEQPILSGGRHIGEWTEATVNGKSCWVAHLPEVAGDL